MMQPHALASLKQEYETAFTIIAEKTEKLEAFKKDYKVLRNRLKTLPDRASYDALIPLGAKALAYGKIVHTNEILCMLGDNWFMECSAKTACEVVDRRIKKCNQHLEEQKREADRLESWKSSLTKLIVESAENDSMEIVEEVSEEDYVRMAEEHRQSVKRHHEELARAREEKSPAQSKSEDDEFFARLDELELEEEIMQAEETYKKRQLKSAQKSSVVVPSTSSIKTKPRITKHVQFNNIPEIREIPSLAETKAMTSMRYADVVASSSTSRAVDSSEDNPKIPPTHPVEGVSVSVVERSAPSTNLVDNIIVTAPLASTSSSSSSSNDIPPLENVKSSPPPPIKKLSLFMQRRGAN